MKLVSRALRSFCRNIGGFEIGFYVISMPYPNRNCETESLFMRLDCSRMDCDILSASASLGAC
jgi:hypothetical protein